MSTSRQPAQPWQQGLVAGGAALLCYLATLSRDFGGDDTVFAQVVDFWLHHGGTLKLLHPHHPLHLLLVAAVASVTRWITGAVFVLDAGAWVSATAAALVVGGLTVLLRRAGFRDTLALATAALVAVTGGLWSFGTLLEVAATAAPSVLFWLWVMAAPRPRWGRVATSLALLWLSHIFLTLLLLPTAWRLRRTPRTLLAAVVAGVLLPALLLGLLVGWTADVASTVGILRGIFTSGVGGLLAAPSPAAVGLALHDLVTWRWFDTVPLFGPTATAWFDGLQTLALLLLAPLPLLGAAVTLRRKLPLGQVALGGIAALLPLWLVYNQGNAEHMVVATSLFAVLVAYGAAALPGRIGEALVGTVAACLLVANGLGSAVPASRAENSWALVVATFVQQHLPEDGLLLTVGTDARLRLGLPYLAGRRVSDLTLLVEGARRQRSSADTALAAWAERGAASRALWLSDDVLDPKTLDYVQGLGVTPAAWRGVLARLSVGPPETLAADAIVVRREIRMWPARLEALAPSEP